MAVTEQGPAPGWTPRSEFLLEREGEKLHIRMRGLNNHELRNVLIGMWLSLEEDDRLDHIEELRHYAGSDSGDPIEVRPPGMAVQIADAIREARA